MVQPENRALQQSLEALLLILATFCTNHKVSLQDIILT